MKLSLSPKTFFLLFFLLLLSAKPYAQNAHGDAYVDQKGVIKWSNTNEEVHGFGVNYTAPFAHAYRTAQRMGVDVKKAIDNDVYHFTRLGFDLYRVHVWDTEISDTLGNLLENEHLETFDYLLKELKDRGINFILTPIAYWGNGWPEPDEDTPGFSHKYGKAESLTNPGAIKAQQNYLKQFLNHVNPYTGVAYKDEPNLIAVEVSNEPHHRGKPKEVTAFIRKMLNAIRSTGTKKPVFYNISHSTHLENAYFDAGINGGTFQWYPTGLGFGKELEGNLLPNVNDYHIPFDSIIRKNHGAKVVYEFDAADLLKSYMYPAMARSFRKAGIQLATQFAYDPTFMASHNTEYNTHYTNLAYTPTKALSLMIAGKVFHEVPMYKDFGSYPQNLEFGNFRISYQKNLAVYNSENEFIYTNSNEIEPKNPERLEHLAGYGISEVVEYEGKGAYFLDKLKPSVWRLEVMPDAIIVQNPLGKNSPDKTVAVINWKSWPMKLKLGDLQSNFSVAALNKGNHYETEAENGQFQILPGIYLLKAKGADFEEKEDYKLQRIGLREFSAPAPNVERTYVLHEPMQEISADSALSISAEVISNEEIDKVEAWLQNGNEYEAVELKPGKGYKFSAEIPQKLLKQGFLKYRLIVRTAEDSYTFPGGTDGNPGQWDFYQDKFYTTRIVPKEAPISLFDAAQNADHVVGEWRPGNKTVPTGEPGEAEYQVNLEQLFHEDVENKNAKPIYDYSFRYNFNRQVQGRWQELQKGQKLVVKAESLTENPVKLQIALIMKNGAAFGKIIELQPGLKEYEIALEDLQPVKTVTLPRPYPSFLPYYFEHSDLGDLQLKDAESLQFSIGPGIEQEQLQQPKGVGIVWVELK